MQAYWTEFLGGSTQVCTIFGGVGEIPNPMNTLKGRCYWFLRSDWLSKSMYFWALLSCSGAAGAVLGTWKVVVVCCDAS